MHEHNESVPEPGESQPIVYETSVELVPDGDETLTGGYHRYRRFAADEPIKTTSLDSIATTIRHARKMSAPLAEPTAPQ